MRLYWNSTISLITFVSLSSLLSQGDASASTRRRKLHSGWIPTKVRMDSSEEANLNSGEYSHSHSQTVIFQRGSLPKELEGMEPEQKLLYRRALVKDYDFAPFGKPCLIYTVDELEEFLGIFEDRIELPQGNGLSTGSGSLNSVEKGEALEKLFNHSRSICDFRKILKCHKHFHTCACAHSSMGANRWGSCKINIGHPCELSRRTLAKLGVLMLKETNPLKCLLENAECAVLEVASGSERKNSTAKIRNDGWSPIPARKICKCRDGYWGSTCSRKKRGVQAKTR